VSALVALALLLGASTAPARAHLVPSGADTLLGMLAASDGLLLARSAAATTVRDDGSAATPFLARETIAGSGPTGGFVLDQPPPPLRYAELQDALLLVDRRQGDGTPPRWFSVQPAGAAILIDGGDLDTRTRDVLRRLWAVAHPPAGEAENADHGAAALIDALSLREKKLRALAFLDLSALAASPEHFTKAQASRLVTYGDQPGDDAELAPAVRDLGKKLGGAPMKAARARREGAAA
jgi:hypothetical protein